MPIVAIAAQAPAFAGSTAVADPQCAGCYQPLPPVNANTVTYTPTGFPGYANNNVTFTLNALIRDSCNTPPTYSAMTANQIAARVTWSDGTTTTNNTVIPNAANGTPGVVTSVTATVPATQKARGVKANQVCIDYRFRYTGLGGVFLPRGCCVTICHPTSSYNGVDLPPPAPSPYVGTGVSPTVTASSCAIPSGG